MSRIDVDRAHAEDRLEDCDQFLAEIERLVFDLADTISVVVYGQVIASGPPETIRANAAVQEAYLGKLAA